MYIVQLKCLYTCIDVSQFSVSLFFLVLVHSIPLFASVMNNYQAAAAAAQGFGPPASPHTTTTRGGFPATNSPGPTIDMYSSSGADSVGYVQAASPQPSGFPAIAVSRAPLNYSPVSYFNHSFF